MAAVELLLSIAPPDQQSEAPNNLSSESFKVSSGQLGWLCCRNEIGVMDGNHPCEKTNATMRQRTFWRIRRRGRCDTVDHRPSLCSHHLLMLSHFLRVLGTQLLWSPTQQKFDTADLHQSMIRCSDLEYIMESRHGRREDTLALVEYGRLSSGLRQNQLCCSHVSIVWNFRKEVL